MKREELISYAISFVSFLLDSKIFKHIDKIILFGSVSRGDFDEESDIDIFIDTNEEISDDVKKQLNLFKQSETQKKWELKGLKNELSLKIGDLDKWKLKRDMISNGIMLYGKYKQVPENIKYYLLIKPTVSKLKLGKKIKIWRKLYGYKQKVGPKIYITKGLVEKLDGKRLESGILVPIEKKNEIITYLNKEKIDYTINEIWSDNL